MTPESSPAPGRPSYIIQDRGRQRWIIFGTCFASFMCVLDSYIVNISLPVIAHDFNISTSAVVRVVIVYLLILTSTIPVFGKLGDRQGLTRVFTAGFIVFTIGSLLCGISISINMLTILRVMQALGGPCSLQRIRRRGLRKRQAPTGHSVSRHCHGETRAVGRPRSSFQSSPAAPFFLLCPVLR